MTSPNSSGFSLTRVLLLIENGHKLISSSQKKYLDLIFWFILNHFTRRVDGAYFKGHSLLFILASYILPKSCVHGTKFSLFKIKGHKFRSIRILNLVLNLVVYIR